MAPPEDLKDDALLEWERVVGELTARGLPLIRPTLILYCQTWSINQAANKYVIALGSVIKSNGQVMSSPFYRVFRETAVLMNSLLGSLGLSNTGKIKAKEELEELPL